jgi:hypothetical protein
MINTNNTGRRLPSADRALGKAHGSNKFDVGFHAGADFLGFPGGKLNVSPGNGKPDHINYPGVPNLNQGPYKQVELEFAELANTPGNSVYADFRRVFYEGNLTQISYRVNDGPDQIERFLNQPGGGR